MRKWTTPALLAAGYAFSVWALGRLPEQVVLRWDLLLPGLPESALETMSRAGAAFLLPTVAASVWLLLGILGTRAAGVERFRETFDIIVVTIMALLLLLHAVTLGTVLGWPTWTMRAFTALVGVGIIVLGNVMPRTRPNWVAGVRTSRTMADPDLWRRTHRWFGAPLVATGVAVIAASLFDAHLAVIVGVAGGLLSAVTAGIVASRGAPGTGGTPAVLTALMMAAATGLEAQAPPREDRRLAQPDQERALIHVAVELGDQRGNLALEQARYRAAQHRLAAASLPLAGDDPHHLARAGPRLRRNEALDHSCCLGRRTPVEIERYGDRSVEEVVAGAETW